DDRYGFGTLDAAKTVSRMAVPRTGQISYAFRPVSKGQALGAYEPATNAIIYACEAGSVASTAIQELKKGDSHLFTISQVENHQAVAAGYVSGFLAYACLQQPHDTNTFMRSINVFAEFRNIYPKP
ncbi:MAG TPA: hypothetical protein VK978_00465, partial [Candidatus Saccharimonadales bacterium]|nr:hypothetical protein [Candidatus Saccharimonadales bacterium]